MRFNSIAMAGVFAAAASPLIVKAAKPDLRIVSVIDTVFVKSAPAPIDYDELARRVALRISVGNSKRTVIEGDLIVTGRLGVGGEPEAGTRDAVTIRAPNAASIGFISNEALKDPQRIGDQHRHVGALSLGQDGGLRLEQNATCYADERSCVTEDPHRRRAYTGFDSVGDMSFYLSDVDSLTGQTTAPRSQSLVFRLLDSDGHIHINAYRPGQQIYFNGSTTLNAADLQWAVPLARIPQ